MAKKIEITHVWLISYIDSDNIDNVEKDLSKKSVYKDVRSYIPVVKVLNKQFKGKSLYTYVPFLFNYGFFEVPLGYAKNKEFLDSLKEDIRAIYGWVKDDMRKSKKSPYYGIPIAVAKPEEISQIMKEQGKNSIYSADDLERVKPGDIVNLKGYPFDNIDAEIISINNNKKEVLVSLQIENSIVKEVTVAFDNVFYSIYQGGYLDNGMRERSIEELSSRCNSRIDRFLFNS